MTQGWTILVSRAHDWRQQLPLKDNIVVCTRCGHKVPIGQWGRKPCARHGEKPTSGFAGVLLIDGVYAGRFGYRGTDRKLGWVRKGAPI